MKQENCWIKKQNKGGHQKISGKYYGNPAGKEMLKRLQKKIYWMIQLAKALDFLDMSYDLIYGADRKEEK